MQGGKHKQPHGYSVIETMIFMAVSGLMFIFAAGFISGKQANVEYRQSVNDINAQVRTIVNDVSNGQYDSLGSYKCSANDASGRPAFTAGVAAQGTNGGRNAALGTSGCIFLGKILQFGVNNDPTKYAIYTVAARQTRPSSNDTVKNFTDAQPIIIDTAGLNLTRTRDLLNGLSFTSAWECNKDCVTGAPAPSRIGAFGFFGSFGGYTGGSTNNESGSQSIFTAVVPSTYFTISPPSLNNNEANMVSTINTQLPNMDTPATNFVTGSRLVLLCFTYNNRKGSMTIGGSNGQSFTTDAQLGQRVNPKC
jgi:hypothetical protein